MHIFSQLQNIQSSEIQANSQLKKKKTDEDSHLSNHFEVKKK